MGQYVNVAGLKTWYDEQGSGDPLVLLHGGLVTNETWGGQLPAFAEHFRVIAPERRGHGHTPDVEGPFTYDDMAKDTIAFLDAVVKAPAHLVGWSDGGIIGLIVARDRPDLLRNLVVIGTNFDTTGVVPEAEAMQASMTPDAPDMAMFRMMYEASSPDGPEHWPVLLAKALEMMGSQPHIPVEDLARIGAPTLVVVGDDDMVSLEHTGALYRTIPNSELAVIPGTSHAVPMEKPDLLNRIVLEFLQNDPVPTFLPLRRAPGAEAHTA
jgi:pimeloyl-ACP methyl ester carboxylesterase